MVRFLVAAVLSLAVCSALPQEPPPPPPPAGPAPPPPGVPAPPPPPPAPEAAPASAAPAQPSGQNASIISSSSTIDADGSFNYSYELSNGIKAEQSGYLKGGNSSMGPTARSGGDDSEGSGGGDEVQVVTGSFSYVAPDGKTISVKYTADDTGYHPMTDFGGQSGQPDQSAQPQPSGQPNQ